LVCEGELESELRALLRGDDDYLNAGKPVCDYDDPAAREALVDALNKDARALLIALDGDERQSAVSEAAALLASVTGQDLEEGEDGVFRIAGGSPRIGSSRLLTLTPATAIRRPRAGLSATRVTCRSTRTRS
jgi:hypothetical protein